MVIRSTPGLPPGLGAPDAHVATSRSSMLARTPAELLFVCSSLAQNLGSATAVTLFDEVAPQTVAWIRVSIAATVLFALARRRNNSLRWTRRELKLLTAFGLVTVMMNVCFYLALERLSLGKGLTIEFIGPITVAAWRTRSRRNALALLLAVVGVAVLGGVEIDAQPLGLVLILIASCGWAAHIVFGAHIAKLGRGPEALGTGLAIGALTIAPWAMLSSGPVWSQPSILGRCALVGVLSSVVGYSLDQHVLRRVTVRRFALFMALVPVVALGVGLVVLHQHPSPIDYFGVAVVVTAVGIQDRN